MLGDIFGSKKNKRTAGVFTANDLQYLIRWNLLTVYTFARCRHDMRSNNNDSGYFSIAHLSKHVNANKCQYLDVSIGDRSGINLNFSSCLCKRVRHVCMRLPLLDRFGRPRLQSIQFHFYRLFLYSFLNYHVHYNTS